MINSIQNRGHVQNSRMSFNGKFDKLGKEQVDKTITKLLAKTGSSDDLIELVNRARNLKHESLTVAKACFKIAKVFINLDNKSFAAEITRSLIAKKFFEEGYHMIFKRQNQNF